MGLNFCSEICFWMPEAHRGKVTCQKFQFTSSGARDWISCLWMQWGTWLYLAKQVWWRVSPFCLVRSWSSLTPPGAWNKLSCASGPQFHLLWHIALIFWPRSQQEWVAAPCSCKGHHRPEANWMLVTVLQAHGNVSLQPRSCMWAFLICALSLLPVVPSEVSGFGWRYRAKDHLGCQSPKVLF